VFASLPPIAYSLAPLCVTAIIEDLGRLGKKQTGLIYLLLCLQEYDMIITMVANRYEQSVGYCGRRPTRRQDRCMAGSAIPTCTLSAVNEDRPAIPASPGTKSSVESRQTFSKTKERKMQYTAMLLSLSLLVSAGAVAVRALAAEANKMSQTIFRAGSQGSTKGPAEFFTGNVRVDRLFPVNDTAHLAGAYVTFEPGARSAWHTHPTGQYLIVTTGVGRTQAWGGPIEEIKAGDVIWCPPQVKHWHGASPTTAMTHIALTGTINGKNVEWMEQVTDEQYNGK
jgi:quercetin dioxygenase-like cupin family protein